MYPEYRIPECIGGYRRGESGAPGAYPRANTPQLWNASAFPLLIHTILGFHPVAALETLVVDPVLPTWLPELVLHDLRLAGAKATLWRDASGSSHVQVLHTADVDQGAPAAPEVAVTLGCLRSTDLGSRGCRSVTASAPHNAR
ncbi:MAG: hypothetical protein LC753_08505 [Acidobacteria bacterium]|nr:hypothetical protein [Acidobacteriota bacterium]MCA1650308.1 hypothetical protein [Acidobacteriota bacterium]